MEATSVCDITKSTPLPCQRRKEKEKMGKKLQDKRETERKGESKNKGILHISQFRQKHNSEMLGGLTKNILANVVLVESYPN